MDREQLLAYYRRLSPAERIELLADQERVKAQVEADQQCLLAVIDTAPERDLDPDDAASVDRHFVRDEVAMALRLSYGTARARMVHAHELVHRFPALWALMATGAVGFLHARTLVEATGHLDHATAAAVESRVLARAGTQTPAEFRRAVRRAVAALDPAGQAERHQAAAETRRVTCSDEPDGMASIYVFLPGPDAAVVMTSLDTHAGRVSDPNDHRTMDQRRADALVALAADALDRVGLQHGRRPAVQVTVALSTLLGLDTQPGELTGHGPIAGPIPAEVARELAFDPTGTWTRLLTDGHGQLLELGTTTYRPPRRLQDHVIARDHTCRAPGCARHARSCDLDHVIAWNDGGTTAPDNLHPLCPRHHQLKHHPGWTVTRTEDGTTHWQTPTGLHRDTPPDPLPTDLTADLLASAAIDAA